jgi:hypothetical protein
LRPTSDRSAPQPFLFFGGTVIDVVQSTHAPDDGMKLLRGGVLSPKLLGGGVLSPKLLRAKIVRPES